MDRLKLTASLLALIVATPALAQTIAPSVGVIGATVPTAQGGANGVVLLRDPRRSCPQRHRRQR
jgi:3-phytase